MIKIQADFLPSEIAEQLHIDILNTPEEWWRRTYMVENNCTTHQNTIFERSLDWEAQLTNSLRQGKMTYQFTRSVEHKEGCSCYECELKKYAASEMKEVVEKETGIAGLELAESFISVYERGDFLSTHTDKGKGDVAFVLNLTKGWKPEYGGLFHSQRQYVIPTFNSLIIMTLEDGGQNHFVSEVSQRATHSRLAFSGWYKKSK